jgi:cellulase/cellobiase CelA1
MGKLNQHWECQITGDSGRVTFTGEDYNRTLQPDAKAQFGFCAQR